MQNIAQSAMYQSESEQHTIEKENTSLWGTSARSQCSRVNDSNAGKMKSSMTWITK
jgi:hypothetical protein